MGAITSSRWRRCPEQSLPLRLHARDSRQLKDALGGERGGESCCAQINGLFCKKPAKASFSNCSEAVRGVSVGAVVALGASRSSVLRFCRTWGIYVRCQGLWLLFNLRLP